MARGLRPHLHGPLDEAGFSLVEALIAVAILAVGLVPISSALNYGYKNVVAGKQSFVGTALLERAAEETKNTPYDSLASLTVDDFGGDLGTRGYHLERTVAVMAGMTDRTGNPMVKKVQIRISRGDRTLGRTTLLIHKKGL